MLNGPLPPDRAGARFVVPVHMLVVTLFAVLVLSFASMPAHAQTTTLTVFAAASLTNAFTELGTAFAVATPGVEVIYNFAGSSSLVAQLREGAPADVFASANLRQMVNAQEAGRIGGEARTFARNRLVLIMPADNPANVTAVRDLATPGLRFVVAAPGVPVRDYTDLMLARLASVATYGNAYRDAVNANIVSEEDNVRQVLLKVALGEADAGIVYQSDVTPDSADQVQVIPIPSVINSTARYPIAITNDTASPELASAFVDYVLSAEGQAILVKWGFLPVN
jgi:molybdate transport system substrate-binding protein